MNKQNILFLQYRQSNYFIQKLKVSPSNQPVPQVNPPGPVVDRPVRNRRPPGHLKDYIVKSKQRIK